MWLLALDFREAITLNDKDGMLHWIRTATQSGIGPLVRFATGLNKDFNAVVAVVETSFAVACWFAFYNFCGAHKSIRVTPAMPQELLITCGVCGNCWRQRNRSSQTSG
jgi:hypothetical protein